MTGFQSKRNMASDRMNDRIKELAKQFSPIATIGNWGRVEWADTVYPQLGDKMYAAEDVEKFAELIVRECAGKCLSDDRMRILNHFGVKE